jgi:hypothetical protein
LCVDDIDREIVRGVSYRDVAGRYALSKSAVGLHALSHVPEALARAAGEASAVTAAQLVSELRGLRTVALELLEEARDSGDHSAALGAIGRLEKLTELQGRLAGELVDRRVVEQRSSAFDAEWLRLRALILGALAPYPDALVSVRTALTMAAGSGDAS